MIYTFLNKQQNNDSWAYSSITLIDPTIIKNPILKGRFDLKSVHFNKKNVWNTIELQCKDI